MLEAIPCTRRGQSDQRLFAKTMASTFTTAQGETIDDIFNTGSSLPGRKDHAVSE